MRLVRVCMVGRAHHSVRGRLVSAKWKLGAEHCPPYLGHPIKPEEEIDTVVQGVPDKQE
jgi:hypothetical protein